MEDSGVGSKTDKETGAAGAEITRSQSSLELLSNTADEISRSNTNNNENDNEQEPSQQQQQQASGEESSSSAGSHHTASSARITPSISQVSIAASPGGVLAATMDSGETKDDLKQETDSKPSASSSLVPTSPFTPQPPTHHVALASSTRATPLASGMDVAGLPIDHYGSGHNPAPLPLHESYLSQSPHHFFGGPTSFALAPPSLQHTASANTSNAASPAGSADRGTPFEVAGALSPATPLQQGAAATRRSSATQAAFAPPRSSSARPSSSTGHFPAYQNMPPTSSLLRQPAPPPPPQQFALHMHPTHPQHHPHTPNPPPYHHPPPQQQHHHHHHGAVAAAMGHVVPHPVPAASLPHPQEQLRQPPHPGAVAPRVPVAAAASATASAASTAVNKCDSFQSDSTSSLVSEQQQHHHQQQPTKLPPAASKPKALATSRLRSPPRLRPPPRASAASGSGGSKEPKPTYEELEASNLMLVQQNAELRNELEKRNQEVSVLRGEVRDLDLKVKELRQFPAGKISQIPMADMLEIMEIYGSEVSDTVMPPRKVNIQKASVIRQFRRWNPNFLKHFYFKDGKWVPKLGQEGELARRRQARKKGNKGKAQQPSSSTTEPPQPATAASMSQEQQPQQTEPTTAALAYPAMPQAASASNPDQFQSASPSSPPTSSERSRKRRYDGEHAGPEKKHG